MNNEELREKIVKLALLQYRKKYVHGKNGPEVFDCAGLVYYVYKEILGINVYENGIGLSTTTKIMTNGKGTLELFGETEEKNLDSLKKGDILLFHRQSLNDNQPKNDNKYPGHCGIYLGEDKFIHATKIKGEVVVNNLDDVIDVSKKNKKKWKKILIGYKNIIN